MGSWPRKSLSSTWYWFGYDRRLNNTGFEYTYQVFDNYLLRRRQIDFIVNQAKSNYVTVTLTLYILNYNNKVSVVRSPIYSANKKK